MSVGSNRCVPPLISVWVGEEVDRAAIAIIIASWLSGASVANAHWSVGLFLVVRSKIFRPPTVLVECLGEWAPVASGGAKGILQTEDAEKEVTTVLL